eukprot:scaffold7041_cov311-Pinguiococcus_pyrenoidosus.AAC.2
MFRTWRWRASAICATRSGMKFPSVSNTMASPSTPPKSAGIVLFTAICIATCVFPAPGTPQSSVMAEDAKPPPKRRSNSRMKLITGFRRRSATCNAAAVLPSSTSDCASLSKHCVASLSAQLRRSASSDDSCRAPQTASALDARRSRTVRIPYCSSRRVCDRLRLPKVLSGRSLAADSLSEVISRAKSAGNKRPENGAKFDFADAALGERERFPCVRDRDWISVSAVRLSLDLQPGPVRTGPNSDTPLFRLPSTSAAVAGAPCRCHTD